MCQSKAEGGFRCAAHTRPGFQNVIKSLDGSEKKRIEGQEAVVAFASTPTGHKEVSTLVSTYKRSNKLEDAAWLQECADEGKKIAAARLDAARMIDLAHKSPLATWEPVDVDRELAELYYQEQRLMQEEMLAKDTIYRIAGVSYSERRSGRHMSYKEAEQKVRELVNGDGEKQPTSPISYNGYDKREAERGLARVDDINKRVKEVEKEMTSYEKEFSRRGGWPRAFLVVTNGIGHVHSSMGCSTCYPTTQYSWMVEYSGKNEDTIVEAAGERACTICYPSAPVEILNRPTKMFSQEEKEKDVRRQEREQKRNDKKAKEKANAPTASGEPLKVQYDWGGRPWSETFKTERAAVSWYTDQKVFWSDKNPSRDNALAQVENALSEKHGKTLEQIREDLEKKIKAKKRREGMS